MKHFINTPLAPYSSFNIGGEAKNIYLPETVDELRLLLDGFREKNEKYYIFGNASNVVFPDNGLDCPVIFTTELVDVLVYSNVITADCGATMSKVASVACRSSLSGAEFMYGIPGTVGGGTVMNAGAYGSDFSQILIAATVYLNGRVFELKNEELRFSHRSSVLQSNGASVLSARFMLKDGTQSEIKALMDKNMNSRKAKQPLSYPSAGSVFKRPPNNFAGALIEQSGLKGYRIGGAEVSEKHAGFIINTGEAKQQDVKRLVEHIKKKVYADHGILLECEIKFIDN